MHQQHPAGTTGTSLADTLTVHLGPLTAPVCHGYGHGCTCPTCRARQHRYHQLIVRGTPDHEAAALAVHKPKPKQPWDTHRAA